MLERRCHHIRSHRSPDGGHIRSHRSPDGGGLPSAIHRLAAGGYDEA